jgi:hypothetical protein
MHNHDAGHWIGDGSHIRHTPADVMRGVGGRRYGHGILIVGLGEDGADATTCCSFLLESFVPYGL